MPEGASQTYLGPSVGRAEALLVASKASLQTDTVQWIHEHAHGEPCTGACGPLAEALARR